MTICERMFQIFEEEDKKPADLCKLLDVNTSKTSSWKTRNTDPPAKYILPICEFLGVTPEYLLSGEGPRTRSEQRQKILNNASSTGITAELTSDEQELLEYYKKLPSDLRAEIRGEAKGYANALKYQSDKTETKIS